MPSEYHGHVLLSACVGSSTLAARIDSCLCFVAPKQGPDSGPQNGATILKLVAQLPNLWPLFWAHSILRFAFCKECVELQQVASFIHVSCAWCQDAGFTVFSTVWFCSVSGACKTFCFFFISFRWLDQERCLASCSLSMVITVVTAYI